MFGGWRPKAVVFDCDGLLVDTESCWASAEAQLCAARGLTLAAHDAAALIGASVPDTCRQLCERLADGCTPAQVQEELVARVVEIVARLPAAVASNSPRALLDLALRRGGLSDAVAVSVAADEVAAQSPRPTSTEPPARGSGSRRPTRSRWRTRRPGSAPRSRRGCGRSQCQPSPDRGSAPR